MGIRSDFFNRGRPMVNSQTQVNSNQTQQVKFENCLVVTRHKLLQVQEEDIKIVCRNISVVPELPADPIQLKSIIGQYDTVIGVLPIQLQLQILQAKKVFLTFIMTSLGVTDSREDAEKKAEQYKGRTTILAPSKEGEKYRVTRYDGLKIVKEIKIVDEWVIQHQS